MATAVAPTDTLDQKRLLKVLSEYRRGDFSARMPSDRTGLAGKICDALNDAIERNEKLAKELERLSTVVGKAGNIKQRAVMPSAEGQWANAIESVNTLVSDLVQPTTEVARVIGAVAKGDLSQSMALEIDGRPLTGEFLRTAKVVNTMVDQLGTFASEVTRVAREVGTEGKLGGQAVVKGVGGTWKDLTDNVNFMAANLTSQVRNIAEVTTAVARGDLSKKITVDVKGEILELKNTINVMVDQLNAFASEVTRVAREVGTEGKLGGQAEVKGVAGTWKDLTDNVNQLAGNLTVQLRDVSRVATAIASGDLSKKITVDARGEILQIKDVINTMVDQLGSFASEVSRVAREVGTEGKLGGQADVRGVAGTWKDLTDNVNTLAGNLTSQVRNIAEVTTAVARGDLSKKITVDVRGEILELKNTINTMVDQLSSFASEVTRVAKEVGTEGKLGGQAEVKGVAGTWRDLTDNVNQLAGNLTVQLRDVSKVSAAIATGDLTQKITVEAAGEILQIKNVINTMTDQLNAFASEVTRVAREVGTEGKLGGQADVRGVAGTWRDLTDSVNSMAGNLTAQVRNIADVTTAVAKGDLSRKITVDVRGEILELKNTINTMVDQLSAFASEVTRVAREVGSEGKLGGQADVPGVAGTWKDLTDSVNFMAGNLTAQVRNIAEVTTAVANGDLSKKITVDVRGEILELKNTINVMVDQLNAFASEVTRVAREVGTEGKLGGQAEVKGVAGTWKDLTDNVNQLAGNLTVQLRDVSRVSTAIANGDLTQKITVEVRGEILQIKDVINKMVDQLGSFASEVTRVAKEVGTEGKLGGQADVRGVAGTWKDLTDNVNAMASNLTGQVRNIAEVTTAVANGDLSKKITVDARAEILELKNTINTMVDQLNAFASEVTRVAREVGTEGKLGGQAQVKGVAGTWKDLTDNVNFMASNLTSQVRNIADVTTAVANGDLSKKITVDVRGEILELKNTINTMVDQLNGFASEVTRVAREVGTEGKLGGQAQVRGVGGTWKDLTDSVNFMAANLTNQVRNIAAVTTAVANGDLSKKITVDVRGEILELKITINTMVDQLGTFASEVTRVAREVGTEGKLGGQAQVQRRRRHLEGPDRQRQLHGRQPHQPGARHRPGRHRRRQRQPAAQAGARSQGRDRTAGGNDQRHDRHAGHLRRPGHDGGPRGRHRRQAGRSGERARRGRHLARHDRQRQPPRGEPHHAGARHRGSRHRRHQGRPVAVDRRRGGGRGRGAQGQHQRDDLQPARHDREEHRAGLAEDQPREVHPAAAGPARPDHGVTDDPVRAGAAGLDAAWRVLRQRFAERRARAEAARQLRLHRAQASREQVPGRGRPGRTGGAREAEHPAQQRARRLRPDQLRSRRAQADEHRRHAGAVRRRGQGGDRAGLVLPLQRHSPDLPQPADRRHRHRPQHHHRDDEDGGAAETVAVARRRAADAAAGADRDQLPPGSAGAHAAGLRGTAQAAAGGAAADQRGARREGGAARQAEHGGREEEPRDRAGADVARGEGRAAGADVEVQVRVPRQHVARAAHAAQQPVDSLEAALTEQRQEPQSEAGRVRADDSLVRVGPARADQRDPGSLEDRVWHHGRRRQGAAVRRSCKATSSAASRKSRSARAWTSTCRSATACRPRSRPIRSGCSRC